MRGAAMSATDCFAAVPCSRHRQVRAQVLQSFPPRPRLYHGEYALALLEARARTNPVGALWLTHRRLAQ